MPWPWTTLILDKADPDLLFRGEIISDLKYFEQRLWDEEGEKFFTLILEERFGEPETSISTDKSLLYTSSFSVTKSTDYILSS
jgi:hypothetical protein